jgi:hypothetical protein
LELLEAYVTRLLKNYLIVKMSQLDVVGERWLWCPFSLHKLQVDLLDRVAEAVEFGHKAFEH